MLEELLEVYEYQRKLINYNEVLKHYKTVLEELEEEEYE